MQLYQEGALSSGECGEMLESILLQKDPELSKVIVEFHRGLEGERITPREYCTYVYKLCRKL